MAENKGEWKSHPANCWECTFLENKNPFCELGNERWFCTLKKVKMPRLQYPRGKDSTKEIRAKCFDRVAPGTELILQDEPVGQRSEGEKIVKGEFKNEVVKAGRQGLFKWLS